jgi:hypothetical protein
MPVVDAPPDRSPPAPPPDAAAPDLPPPEPGSILWRIPAAGWTFDTALDPDGNLVVAGTSFPGGTGELSLAKYTPDGAQLWRRDFGGPTHQTAGGVSVASNGVLAVGGDFTGRTDFGGQTLTGSTDGDAFVAFYDADGMLIPPVVQFPGPRNETVTGLELDQPSGDVLVTGYGYPVQIGAQTIDGNFVARIRRSGAVAWARNSGGYTMTARPGGGPIFAGGDANSPGQVSRTERATGALGWEKRTGPGLGADVLTVALSPDNRQLVLAGRFHQPLLLGSRTVQPQATDSEDVFVMSLSADTGAHLWSEVSMASRGNDYPNALCSDAQGNFYLVGAYGGSDAGTVGEPASGGTLAFVRKYGPDGSRRWLKVLPDSSDAQSVICHASGILVGLNGEIAKLAP